MYILYINTHVCIISKLIGIEKNKGRFLSMKGYISGHRCERTNMAAKHKVFMNCSKNFIAIYQKISLPNKEY